VTEVPASELVAGDLLILEEGDVIAADGAVRRAANLSIDEAMLTGESLPQKKYAAPDPGVAIAWARAGVGATDGPPGPIVPSSATTVIAGTIVLAGSGSARIIATGARTRFAGIARPSKPPLTPLRRSSDESRGSYGLSRSVRWVSPSLPLRCPSPGAQASDSRSLRR
jgi:magnesium-transporting ATPase (P-type)